MNIETLKINQNTWRTHENYDEKKGEHEVENMVVEKLLTSYQRKGEHDIKIKAFYETFNKLKRRFTKLEK